MQTSFPYIWNEKNILWQTDNGYRIATGGSDNTYLTVWTEDNVCVGHLSASLVNKKNPGNGYIEKRAKIALAEIKPSHRGQGLGLALYRALLAWLPDDVHGIYSHLPDRSNQRQVPRIYSKLKGYVIDGDHAFIDREQVPDYLKLPGRASAYRFRHPAEAV